LSVASGAFSMHNIASTLLSLILIAAAYGQVDIDKKNHVANRDGGFCGWASLETLGKHHGIKELAGLTKDRAKVMGRYVTIRGKKVWLPNGGATIPQLASELASRKVDHYYTAPGTYSTGLLEAAFAKDSGAIVLFKPPEGERMGHFVIVVGLDDKKAYVVDSNFPGETKTMTRANFFKYWDGSALFLK